VKIFARSFLGEAEAGSLRNGAPIGHEGRAPGQGKTETPGQGEGRTAEDQEDGEPKTGDV